MAVGPGSRSTHARGGGSETETKASYKTTELIVYVVVFIGILVASNTISSENGQTDWFRGDQAWLYITILTVGYMISRGLAKSGSRDPYSSATGGGSGGAGIGERVGAAAAAFRGEPGGSEASSPRPSGGSYEAGPGR